MFNTHNHFSDSNGFLLDMSFSVSVCVFCVVILLNQFWQRQIFDNILAVEISFWLTMDEHGHGRHVTTCVLNVD